MHIYKLTFALLLALVTVPAMAQVNTQGESNQATNEPSTSKQASANTGKNYPTSATSQRIKTTVERLIAQQLAKQQPKQASCCKICCTKHNAAQELLTRSKQMEAKMKLPHTCDTKDRQAASQPYAKFLQHKLTGCHCSCHCQPEQTQKQETTSTKKKQAAPTGYIRTHSPVWQRKVGF